MPRIRLKIVSKRPKKGLRTFHQSGIHISEFLTLKQIDTQLVSSVRFKGARKCSQRSKTYLSTLECIRMRDHTIAQYALDPSFSKEI